MESISAGTLKGLLLGVSRMNQEITVKGSFLNPRNPPDGLRPYENTICPA